VQTHEIATNIGYFFNSLLVIGLLISGGIAYAVDIADRMGWLEPVYANIPLTKVYDKTFTNQVVVIDGKDFIDCTFNGVTFRYNGGYYLFEGARIEGAIAIDTPNDTAGNAINLLTWLDSHTQNHALVERWKKLPPEHFK
jgi:hypothetical protein